MTKRPAEEGASEEPKKTRAKKASTKTVKQVTPPTDIDFEKYDVFLQSGRAHVLKSYFDCLKHILQDTTFVFTSEGLKISAVNQSETIFIFSKLKGSEFEVYHCNGRVPIGVNLAGLHRCLKSCTERDILTLLVEKGQEKLVLQIQADGYTSTYDFPVLDIESNENSDLQVPDFEFPITITIPSSKFQSATRLFENTGVSIIELKVVSDKLTMTSVRSNNSNETLSVNQKTVFDGKVVFRDEEKKEIDIQGLWNLKFLSFFSRHNSSLSDDVRIYMKNDPKILLLEYLVSSLGYVRYILLPSRV